MWRRLHKLTDRQVRATKEPGHYADGGGLYLQVSEAGTKSWVFRFTKLGKAREMGLGPASMVTLAEARDKAQECRKAILDGRDPIEERKAQRVQERAQVVKTMTFKECAQAYIAAHRAGWKNAKHADQWANTLEAYAYREFGSLNVAHIDTGLVLKVLEPIWSTKTETASRVRGRIESVLDWATVRGYRLGDNPARWRGHLDKLLPKPSKVAKTENHPALPYTQIANFMKSLRAEPGISARALEFIILTAARTSEAINADWSEIDFDAKTWVVPAERMKSGREHRVPLSPRAVKVLRQMHELQTEGYVFPGGKEGKPLSNMACLQLLERMGRSDITVHGFRSTFRDWAAEQTNFPREVAEMALAHTIKDAVEAAYRRGDLYEKRVKLMSAWADYCDREQAGNVTPIGKKRSAA